MMTWLRGARCTDPEEMPEMEARPPAENRHGGAPRGERPASRDAPRLTSADQSRLANATTRQVRLSALRPPLSFGLLGGWTRSQGPNPGATTRRGNEEDCAVWHRECRHGQRLICEPRGRAPRSRVPGERSETPISGLPEIGS